MYQTGGLELGREHIELFERANPSLHADIVRAGGRQQLASQERFFHKLRVEDLDGAVLPQVGNVLGNGGCLRFQNLGPTLESTWRGITQSQ